jgi:hypothetical protein
MAMREIEVLGPDTWRDFVASPMAVLLIGKSTCDACTQWSEELNRYLGQEDAGYADVRFGKLLLDQRGLIEFKKEMEWLKEVSVLPFTVIFKDGEKVKDFAGGGIERLTNRLERVSG